MSIQRVPLSAIVANRFRKIESYKLSDSKIDALIQSYDTSGFWDGSIQGRPHPTKPTKIEIAFGHHRIEAARRARIPEIGIVVAARSDADMLRMMANENREEFKGDHLVAIETIAATVEAFGRGEIELPPVDPKTNKAHIYAVAGDTASYTCGTVARFLGWTNKTEHEGQQPSRACRLAFEAYHERANVVPELQQLAEDDRTKQSTDAIVRAAKTARAVATRGGRSPREADAAAKRAARDARKQIQSGAIASRVRDEARKIGRAAAGVDRSAPEIAAFVRARAEGLKQRAINLRDEVDGLLNDVLPYRDQLDDPTMHVLLQQLTFARDCVGTLFDKWLTEFARREVRHVGPTPRPALKG